MTLPQRTPIRVTLLAILVISACGTCLAQQTRNIVGGEKWVWDPVIKQWVFHQGATVAPANRGINALPQSSVYRGTQPRGHHSQKPKLSTERRRDILGGEKWVWDPTIRQWVFHQGTRTVPANRGINAPPARTYLDRSPRPQRTNAGPKQPVQLKQWHGKTFAWNAKLGRWVPYVTDKKRATDRSSRDPQSMKHGAHNSSKNVQSTRSKAITNPYVSGKR